MKRQISDTAPQCRRATMMWRSLRTLALPALFALVAICTHGPGAKPARLRCLLVRHCVRNHRQKIQVAMLPHVPPCARAEQHDALRPRRLADAPREVRNLRRPGAAGSFRFRRHVRIVY